jgi:hypothetical protein
MTIGGFLSRSVGALAVGIAISALPLAATSAQAQQRPNIVMLMTDDTGWNDFGAYGGGANLGHRKEPCSRVGMVRRVVRPAAPRS